ncbi:MAG TPA: hypothetical protein VLR46_05165 [Candidatus Dormibacteraeota bacterium]|nr:hypothetical protein [Candidatus Dormibacteraeota bacterium]
MRSRGPLIGAFHVEADQGAKDWMRIHAADERVIAFDVTRCCGGGKICTVSVRQRRRQDDRRDFATAVLGDGTRLLVDRRAARRLPARFRLTVRGSGPFRRLDLELTGDQWGALLYD